MKLARPVDIDVKNKTLLLEDGRELTIKGLTIDEQLEILSMLSAFFSFMPNEKVSDLPFRKKSFYQNEVIDSVTFFGGTFNPFHLGHLECVKLCPEKNIVIVPDHNPHKELRALNNPLEEFFELLSAFYETQASLYPGFLTLNSLNPTADWITKVKVREINFLMGDDSFMNLLRWKTPEILLNRLTTLYVVPRNFKESDYQAQVGKVKDLSPNLKVIILEDHPYRDLSSTKLRN